MHHLISSSPFTNALFCHQPLHKGKLATAAAAAAAAAAEAAEAVEAAEAAEAAEGVV